MALHKVNIDVGSGLCQAYISDEDLALLKRRPIVLQMSHIAAPRDLYGAPCPQVFPEAQAECAEYNALTSDSASRHTDRFDSHWVVRARARDGWRYLRSPGLARQTAFEWVSAEREMGIFDKLAEANDAAVRMVGTGGIITEPEIVRYGRARAEHNTPTMPLPCLPEKYKDFKPAKRRDPNTAQWVICCLLDEQHSVWEYWGSGPGWTLNGERAARFLDRTKAETTMREYYRFHLIPGVRVIAI